MCVQGAAAGGYICAHLLALYSVFFFGNALHLERLLYFRNLLDQRERVRMAIWLNAIDQVRRPPSFFIKEQNWALHAFEN